MPQAQLVAEWPVEQRAVLQVVHSVAVPEAAVVTLPLKAAMDRMKVVMDRTKVVTVRKKAAMVRKKAAMVRKRAVMVRPKEAMARQKALAI